MATLSKTHWWSRWEVLHKVLEQFGDVELFLRNKVRNNVDISPATRSKLIEILSDQQKCSLLKVELAVVSDLGEHFVKSTYTLEGDGPLVFDCFEAIVKLRAVIHSNHLSEYSCSHPQFSATSCNRTAVVYLCRTVC